MATVMDAARPAQPIVGAVARLGRRLSPLETREAWTPPPLPELIARIDAAVARRRGA